MTHQSKIKTPVTTDVVVIGGGPAGLMAATEAARAGKRVVILEKNARAGEKLRITGGGRCNIAPALYEVRALLSHYGKAGAFLFSPFAQHSVLDSLEWFSSIGVRTVEEAEQRLFPVSQSAVDVTEKMIQAASAAGVTFYTNSAVTGVVRKESDFVVTTKQGEFHTGAVIVATGGNARPETGSTGDGWQWLALLGHTINKPLARLVPVTILERDWLPAVVGIALPKTRVTIKVGGVVVYKKIGKILFTHTGLSGPGILNASHVVSEALAHTESVTITLNFLPDLTPDAWQTMWQEVVVESPNKLVKNVLSVYVPERLAELCCIVAGVGETVRCHSLRAADRRRLGELVQQFVVTVDGVLGTDSAVVTGGGVPLTEIDTRRMESKIVPGLYIVGDVLDINRPSGGFSLQLCWTTGFVAGRAAVVKTRTV